MHTESYAIILMLPGGGWETVGIGATKAQAIKAAAGPGFPVTDVKSWLAGGALRLVPRIEITL